MRGTVSTALPLARKLFSAPVADQSSTCLIARGNGYYLNRNGAMYDSKWALWTLPMNENGECPAILTSQKCQAYMS